MTQPDAPAAPPRSDDLTFRPSPEATVGVELELQIIERDTFDLVPGAPRVLKACQQEDIPGVGAELMQSMLEVRTDVCQSVVQVKEQMLPRLKRVQNVARSMGYELAMSGTHPFHRAGTSAVSPTERYERVADRLAWLAYQFEVFGLHVHVGVPSGEAALGVINVLIRYLPHLLALSANSPYWQGVDTGLASARSSLYGLLPHAGVPRYFGKWKEFRTFFQVMKDCKAIGSLKDIYWDIRPRPDLGTVEFRICDTPPGIDVLLGLVTLTRCLVISALRLLKERPRLGRGDIRRQWIAVENKWLATRHGLEAACVRTPSGKRRPLTRDLEDALSKLKPIAAESGDEGFLGAFQPVAKFETGAERQRRLYRETGNWKAVLGDMVQRLDDALT
jgi:carboxylate-amine ligase